MNHHDDGEVRRLYEEGRQALEALDFEAAVLKLGESAALQPHFKTFELLGEALLQLNRHIEATLYLAAAAGLGKRQSRSRLLLAKALLAQGSSNAYTAALKLKEALELNPQYKAARTLLDEVLAMYPHVAVTLWENGKEP